MFDVAKQQIDELAEDTGEIVNLMVEEYGKGVYLYIARGENAVNLDTTVGTRQYLHASPLGKSILAMMTEDRVDEVHKLHGLPAETPDILRNVPRESGASQHR